MAFAMALHLALPTESATASLWVQKKELRSVSVMAWPRE
jgi:hypothetical protein